LPSVECGGYNASMGVIVDAQSGSAHLRAELDFELWTWSPGVAPRPPEGEFPFVVRVDGKRYELYSDETFAEVELGPVDRSEE
jgi:hypothetical protein